MPDHHHALAGVLSQSGLTPEEQRKLLLQSVPDLGRVPAGRFPEAPNDYFARVKDLLLSVCLPQFGPLGISQPQGQCEVGPRSKACDLVSQELFRNSLRPDWKRPVCEIHDAMIEVVTLMARKEFPLSVLPRWVAQLFSALSHIAKLKVKSRNLSIAPPTNLDVDCPTYRELVFDNLGYDAIRASRQRSNYRANDDEIALDSKGNSLVCPGAGRAILSVFSGLASRRPRF